jgi:hypothetical protein
VSLRIQPCYHTKEPRVTGHWHPRQRGWEIASTGRSSSPCYSFFSSLDNQQEKSEYKTRTTKDRYFDGKLTENDHATLRGCGETVERRTRVTELFLNVTQLELFFSNAFIRNASRSIPVREVSSVGAQNCGPGLRTDWANTRRRQHAALHLPLSTAGPNGQKVICISAEFAVESVGRRKPGSLCWDRWNEHVMS